jgi:hypothetical protein
MDAVHRFFGIVFADLRQRSRSLRFWATILAFAIATWWFLPPIEAGYATLTLSDNSRGYYSSAWVGMTLAMIYGSLLSLAGFYLVRGTIVRDIDTRIWQLLMATPMTRAGYLLAKWCSHMTVFAVIVFSGIAVALAMQWFVGEDRSLRPWEMAKPVLLLSMPGLAITAALAVWFDLLPWLRRTLGSVVYFFVWVALLTSSVAPMTDGDGSRLRNAWLSDPSGMSVAAVSFADVRERQTGTAIDFGFNIGVTNERDAPLRRFEWTSWDLPARQWPGRALWLALALVSLLAAAPLLDWAAARGVRTTAQSNAGRHLRWLDRALDPLARGPFAALAVAEAKLILRPRALWWWAAAIGLMLAQTFAPLHGVPTAMLIAWMLCLDVLARGALRESEHGTGELVFTAAGAGHRIAAVRFVVACALLTALSLPGLVRLAATAPLGAIAALATMLSLVAWGMSLGATSRNGRFFEVLILICAYIGVQGGGPLAFANDALTKTSWHVLGLLPAAALLAWSWPRLRLR